MLSRILRRLPDASSSPPKATQTLAVGIVLLGLLGSAWLVHLTGGAKFAILHLMYLPIILAALVFGTGGGIVAGVAAGLLLGPYMPVTSRSAICTRARSSTPWMRR